MCRHVWKITGQVTHESAFEQMAAANLSKADNLTPDTFVHPVIVTARCDRCGTEKVYRA